MISYTYDFIGLKLWYLSYTSLYDVIFDNMKSYATSSTSQRIPRTCTIDSPGTFQWLPCLCRLSSQSVHLAKWIYVHITVILSLSLWFNRLSDVSSIWFWEILPQCGDFSQHKVAAHSDTFWLFIGCSVLDDDTSLRKCTRTRRIPRGRFLLRGADAFWTGHFARVGQ